MIDRFFFPLGWACPAGHIKNGEKPLDGMRRETKEEVGLTVIAPRLLLHFRHVPNKCVNGGNFHDWWVFEAKPKGSIKANKEAKSYKWVSVNEIKKLKLEPIWRVWFKKLEII